MMNKPPNSCPHAQQIVELTSGLPGNVISTRYSSEMGSSEKAAAPSTALRRYGAASPLVCGAHMSPMYASATNTHSIFMPSRYA